MAATEQKKKLNPGHEMTCVLKLNTSSKGWHKTVSKVLKTIEGVSYSIDMEEGKVTVYGMIDPPALMMRLRKSCKHVELIRVDAGTLRDSRVKLQLKEKELAEDKAYYERYGCYPQQAAVLYNKLGFEYPYRAPHYNHDPYYRSSAPPPPPPPPPHPHHQQYGHYPNNDYYRQQHQPQPVGPYGVPPVRFPQPPPPLDVHPYYDSNMQCRIM